MRSGARGRRLRCCLPQVGTIDTAVVEARRADVTRMHSGRVIPSRQLSYAPETGTVIGAAAGIRRGDPARIRAGRPGRSPVRSRRRAGVRQPTRGHFDGSAVTVAATRSGVVNGLRQPWFASPRRGLPGGGSVTVGPSAARTVTPGSTDSAGAAAAGVLACTYRESLAAAWRTPQDLAFRRVLPALILPSKRFRNVIGPGERGAPGREDSGAATVGSRCGAAETVADRVAVGLNG